jgi:hypothetical protein
MKWSIIIIAFTVLFCKFHNLVYVQNTLGKILKFERGHSQSDRGVLGSENYVKIVKWVGGEERGDRARERERGGKEKKGKQWWCRGGKD